MVADAAKVVTVDGGVLYLAPVGSTGPTSAESTLAGAWKDLGYWAEDGATVTPVPGDTTEINAHTGAPVIRKTKKGNVTLEFPFIELNKDVFEAYWSTTVGADGSYAISDGSANKEYALVYDRLFSNGETDRIFAPRASISDRGAQSNTESDALTHSITFQTLAPSGGGDQIQGWNTALATA